MMGAEAKALRGFRFGERRRSGLFGTVPPSLAAVGIVTLLVAWLAVSGYIPVPVALVVGGGCGWLWFGKIHNRPAHEILPAMMFWWWRKLRSRNMWYRPVALVTDGEQPVALPAVLAGIDVFEFDVGWITPGQKVPIAVVRDRQCGSVTAVMQVSGDGQFALVDADGQDMRIDEWGAAIAGFARENAPVSRVTFHDWTSPVPIRDTVDQLEQKWAGEPFHPARDGYVKLLRDTSASVVAHEVLVEVTVDLGRLTKTRGDSTLMTGLRTVADRTY